MGFLQFTVCEMWSRTYTMHLQLRIFRLQVSSERICAAIADISCMPHAIYCKPGAKCSAHPPVYDIWTVVTDIYKVFTAPLIQATIFNWIVSALLLEMSRQFNVRYTANLVPNTARIPQFTLCELWFRSYTMLLELRIFRVQYSSERICATIGGISEIEWALNGKHGAKYSAHPPVYAMWTVVPDIYNVITAPHIQASIFKWRYQGCYWRYLGN
jgi:hypothetical protein